MEEELNCVAVTFKTNNTSTLEKADDQEIINDDVKTWDQTNPATPDNKQKAPLYTLLHVVAAGLGIVCVILLLVIITLKIQFMLEQLRQNDNLTAQKSDLERQMGELIRERDGFNWTIGVILEYENFPVKSFCPQKVCKPCQDDWVHFQANCYLFVDETRTWKGSRERCKSKKADLVVIESQEEQEFINNHTNDYDYENHGYWIGLKKTVTWTWVDRSKVTVTYWKTQQEAGYSRTCALSLPRAEPLANWVKERCDMWNHWICETRALIKPD